MLDTAPQIYVQQRKEWAEIIVDFETANKYAVLGPDQQEIGFVAERGSGFLTVIKRMLLRSHRGFTIEVMGRSGEVMLHLVRSFFFFFSDLEVTRSDGQKIGSIHRRFGILYKKYDLRDQFGTVFAHIKSPLWRLWTFPIYDSSGKQLGAISKKWGGALREVFTDADTFQIDFGVHQWTPEQKATVFAAAISIDFDFFEDNQGRRSMFDFGN